MPTKFFRVATEGATTDGREIQRAWIEQMAKNYKPDTYGARVWLEHIRGTTPDSSFAALGDVLALEARTVEDGKLALFAQIEALPSLVAMNKAKQKIYSSIEIDPNFAKTGEAYMVGLAVTDSPASIGTEVLKFAAQNPAASPFASKKTKPESLFSVGVESDLGMNDDADGIANVLLNKFGALLESFRSTAQTKEKTETPNAIAVKTLELMGAADAAMKHQAGEVVALNKKCADQDAELQKLRGDFKALTEKLSTQDGNPSKRPAATGNEGATKADC